MGVQDDAERVEPTTLEEWSAWLVSHHDGVPGVWLVAPRRQADRGFGYEEAVTEALRWGWIDSTQRPVDEHRSMTWFAPRRAGSVWTRRNKERVSHLETTGRLEPPGRAAVEAARATGMWTLMDDVEDLVVPDDLAAALDEHPGAAERFAALPPSARKQALAWIAVAKRPRTRAARVAETAARAARGEPVTRTQQP
jgi:uncharacterized protein YdeI (YjbR/CyaY-like superfamily)